jgi:hypothetical protein
MSHNVALQVAALTRRLDEVAEWQSRHDNTATDDHELHIVGQAMRGEIRRWEDQLAASEAHLAAAQQDFDLAIGAEGPAEARYT